uniref:Uncharacterized protein n=1 Tax=Physcomitrium patens TaxID=3218 RepID=A0A2K1IUA3_PHYPA|nr:hypothetical protein PHYPA_024794 [Physcomitrium patens]
MCVDTISTAARCDERWSSHRTLRPLPCADCRVPCQAEFTQAPSHADLEVSGAGEQGTIEKMWSRATAGKRDHQCGGFGDLGRRQSGAHPPPPRLDFHLSLKLLAEALHHLDQTSLVCKTGTWIFLFSCKVDKLSVRKLARWLQRHPEILQINQH